MLNYQRVYCTVIQFGEFQPRILLSPCVVANVLSELVSDANVALAAGNGSLGGLNKWVPFQ